MGASEAAAVMSRAGLGAEPPPEFDAWLLEQRWFGAKAREPGETAILDAVPLTDGPEPLLLLIVEVRSPAGTHELYQVPAGIGPSAGRRPDEVIFERDGVALYDALRDELQTLGLERLVVEQRTVTAGSSTVRFQRTHPERPSHATSTRTVDAEQSNSSVVLDDRRILKVFRRLEPGINPELEMVSFLTEHDFPNIAEVLGFYEYEGELLDSTLGLMQRFLAGARDGWELALEALRDSAGERLAVELEELGMVTGRMHTTLASDPEDPEFAPEEPSDEHVALLTARIDEQIERVFLEMPEREALAPIQGRGEELRDRLAQLSHRGIGGRLIRTHGDFHLGQTLLGPDGWIVLDFEGEPGRPLRERRRKRSPLRDVAGMLRSFAYAALARELLGNGRGAREQAEVWERLVRESFLEGYMAEVDHSILPAGTQAMEKQLAMFELEKVLYELRYDLENRPEWLVVPVRGIERLLSDPTP